MLVLMFMDSYTRIDDNYTAYNVIILYSGALLFVHSYTYTLILLRSYNII